MTFQGLAGAIFPSCAHETLTSFPLQANFYLQGQDELGEGMAFELLISVCFLVCCSTDENIIVSP